MKSVNIYGILLGCFAINFFIAGAARLSSIFFVESITRYNVSRKEASFPFVLTYMMRHLSGPVVGYFEQIFGMRRIIITGCVVATLSTGSCFFAEDILAVTILWGIVLGLSFGCAHHMLPNLLNSYFPGRESTANGLSLCGACVGAVLLPIVMESCINNYGLSGSFLVLSAFISHTIPASLLIKNPEKDINQLQPKVKNTGASGFDKNTHITSFHPAVRDFVDKSSINALNGKNIGSNFVLTNSNLVFDAQAEVPKEKRNCSNNFCTSNLEHNQTSCVCNGNESNYFLTNPNLVLTSSVEALKENKNRHNDLCTSNSKYTQDYFVCHGSNSALGEYVKKVTEREKYCLEINTQNNNSNNTSTGKTLTEKWKKKLTSDKNMFSLQNFMIFTDPIYIIILIVNCGGMTLAVTIWTIILDFVRDKNVGEHFEMYYVVLFPLSDLVGRFVSGFILDRNFLSKPNMTLVCFMCTTFLFVAFVFTSNYIILMVLEFLIAIFLGAIFLLQIVLIHQFMEPSKKIMAMTCRFVLYAPISLGISPMIGYFRGHIGSYDNVFYILCGVSLFCGFSAYFIPCLVKRRSHDSEIKPLKVTS